MAKTTQIMKLEFREFGYHVIYHSDDQYTPFWLYKRIWKPSEYGWKKSYHRIAKLRSIYSAITYVAEQIREDLIKEAKA